MNRPALPDLIERPLVEDDEGASIPVDPRDLDAGQMPRKRRRKRRRSSSKNYKFRGISAGKVFWITTVFGIWSIFNGFIPATITALLVPTLLFIDDKFGFARSQQLRRSHQFRQNFNRGEVIILLILVSINLLIVIFPWLWWLKRWGLISD